MPECFSGCIFFSKCIFLKYISKCIFAKCTRLACLLSFASLFVSEAVCSYHFQFTISTNGFTGFIYVYDINDRQILNSNMLGTLLLFVGIGFDHNVDLK